MIGGYDIRVPENVYYRAELVELATTLGLKSQTAKSLGDAVLQSVEILFLLSVPNDDKALLLEAASLLVYTPKFEHFGIVPLEAMLASTPVLAANLGGPTETVVEGETGWLRDVDIPLQWTEVMQRVLRGMDTRELEGVGEKGRRRVIGEFSKRMMAQRLDGEIEGMLRRQSRPDPWTQAALAGLIVLGLVVGVYMFASGL